MQLSNRHLQKRTSNIILEVEKLNATQELTAMINSSSTVNMMSDEEDCCFQCQEPGHIAWHSPYIKCYGCNEYGHIMMDCSHKIPPSRTPAMHYKAHKGYLARSSLRHHQEEWERWNQSRSQPYYWRHCRSCHHNSHRGSSRSQHWDRCSHHISSSLWSHSTLRENSHRHHCDTLHGSHCRSSTHHSSSGYWSQDCSRSHSQPSYWSSRHESCRSHSYSQQDKKNMKVKIEDPQTDYYSSDDHFINLG